MITDMLHIWLYKDEIMQIYFKIQFSQFTL